MILAFVAGFLTSPLIAIGVILAVYHYDRREIRRRFRSDR